MEFIRGLMVFYQVILGKEQCKIVALRSGKKLVKKERVHVYDEKPQEKGAQQEDEVLENEERGVHEKEVESPKS